MIHGMSNLEWSLTRALREKTLESTKRDVLRTGLIRVNETDNQVDDFLESHILGQLYFDRSWSKARLVGALKEAITFNPQNHTKE